MAKYSTTGKSEVAWVTTVSDYTAITAAEANAGVLGNTVLRAVPAVPRSFNQVDTATIDDKFEKRQVGTRGGDVAEFEILRDDSSEAFLDALAEDAVGFLVIARKGLATKGTFAVADEVDVFPATVGVNEDGSPGRNDADSMKVRLAITDTPERGYAIAS